MKLPIRLLSDRIAALEAKVRARKRGTRPDLSRYAADPCGYCRDVLGVELWDSIGEALKALILPPWLVSIDSGHGVGKTHAAAAAVNWWYDTRYPCWIITTAPTDRDVKDLLWTEIRLQRDRAKIRLPNDLLPAAAEMRSGPEHVAKGYTARDANSAQGRHRQNMLFVFDEKEGVQAAFWDGLMSMFRPGAGDAALVIGNPLTTSSRAYFEHKAVGLDGSPKWNPIRLSSLDHPNIEAGLAGQPLPVPAAVTPAQVDGWVADWCDPVPPGDERPTDITWRGQTYRPGPIGEPRILGRRPTAGSYTVWSEAVWAVCVGPCPPVPGDALPVIGCDCAQGGPDYTSIHSRCGPMSLRHSTGNGWDHLKIAQRLREEAAWCAAWINGRRDKAAVKIKPTEIPINLDDDATGRDVLTLLEREGYAVRGVNAGSSPAREDLYPNKRSELWFLARNRAAIGQMNLSAIPKADRQRIEQQLLAPEWEPDQAGRRRVEEKDDTKKKIGRSPDDGDAVNLAYYEPIVTAGAEWVDKPETRTNWRDRAKRR